VTTNQIKTDQDELNALLAKARVCEDIIFVMSKRGFSDESPNDKTYLDIFRQDRTRYIERYNALRGVVTPEPLKSKYDPILKGFRLEDLIVES